MKLYDAAQVFRMLNGVFCIYKPRDFTMRAVLRDLRMSLCKDLNSLSVRPPGLIQKDILYSDPDTDELLVLGKRTALDYSDHPLVVGERYAPEDLRLEFEMDMGNASTGICLVGVNDGCDLLPKIREANLLKVYHLGGRLGRATLDKTETGKIVEKTTYHHVTEFNLGKVLNKLQANFRKLSYQYAGVDIQSQEAYELASKGMIRPSGVSQSIFYVLKCVEMKKPHFTLEIHSIGETDEYLKNFIHEVGLMLSTTACSTKIRKVRHGHFTLDHALLRKHWTLENILSNISVCKPLLMGEKATLKPDRIIGKEVAKSASDNLADKYLEVIESDFDSTNFEAKAEFLPEKENSTLFLKENALDLERRMLLENEHMTVDIVTDWKKNEDLLSQEIKELMKEETFNVELSELKGIFYELRNANASDLDNSLRS